MNRLCFIFTLLGLLCLANIAPATAATIDPFKGRWRVDMKRTLENFQKFAPQNIPSRGFPPAILKLMKSMSLKIGTKRYVFRSNKRKIINSRYEIISISDEGLVMRVRVKKKVREQLLVLTPSGRLRVIALTNGKPEPRASANHFIWYRVKQKKRVKKSKTLIPAPKTISEPKKATEPKKGSETAKPPETTKVLKPQSEKVKE